MIGLRLLFISIIGFGYAAADKKVVTTIEVEPFLMVKNDAAGRIGNDRFEGYIVDLMNEVAKRASIEYEFRLVADNSYGTLNETTNLWSGMMGELVSNKSDLAAAPLTVSAKREAHVDFVPYMSFGISVMMKKQTPLSKPSIYCFLDPLSEGVWLNLFLSYFGVSFVLFLVARFSPFETQEEQAEASPSATITIRTRSPAGRIAGAAWWLLTFVLISSYTANLTATLTVERMAAASPRITSVEDLAAQHAVKYGTLKRGTTAQFFQTTNNSIYQRMWAVMSSSDPPVFVENIEEGIRRVRTSNGMYAFLLESSTNDYANSRKPCETVRVGTNLDSKWYGFATPKGSDLKEPLTAITKELDENGFLRSLENKWWIEKGDCAPAVATQWDHKNALTMERMGGIFYIIIVGLVLALIVLLIEFLLRARRDAKRQNVTLGEVIRQRAKCCGDHRSY